MSLSFFWLVNRESDRAQVFDACLAKHGASSQVLRTAKIEASRCHLSDSIQQPREDLRRELHVFLPATFLSAARFILEA
jgi:hypothetical protein